MVDAADWTRAIGWLELSDLQVGRDGAAIDAPEIRSSVIGRDRITTAPGLRR
jgi:hypothetical protein